MNYTQNQKISQITPSTLIIGIDIAMGRGDRKSSTQKLEISNCLQGRLLIISFEEKHSKSRLQ
ncbi:hypothetical protein BC6307_21355 [Sutcliffiella cohnii]|uniref:Uncharacterized protein n=1 Tax=Sutcliffiella cohnii TaxID=33932 RepID=A0A223KWF4_9BACI|nr:hypothetical protein [Sutcliffiella cohnii]AST93628.1 hypothetical protein BC6307_21355 [Sutcliffiella cohnii]